VKAHLDEHHAATPAAHGVASMMTQKREDAHIVVAQGSLSILRDEAFARGRKNSAIITAL
jgi:hypothetical protein